MATPWEPGPGDPHPEEPGPGGDGPGGQPLPEPEPDPEPDPTHEMHVGMLLGVLEEIGAEVIPADRQAADRIATLDTHTVGAVCRWIRTRPDYPHVPEED